MSLQFEVVDARDALPRMMDDLGYADAPIGVQAMHVTWDYKTATLLETVREAMCEGSITPEGVVVVADSYSLRNSDTEEQAAQLDTIPEVFEAYRNLGATATFSHPYPVYPMPKEIGRDHSKRYRVGDVAYHSGGMNFTAEGMQNVTDVILRTEDAGLADRIDGEIRFAAEVNDKLDDSVERLDNDNLWLKDGGVMNRSTILDTAEWLADRAEPESLRYVSQLYPSRDLAGVMAERQPQLIVANPPERFGFTLRVLQQRDRRKMPLPGIVEPEKFVHAKVITAILKPDSSCDTRPEGGPVTLTGSHNFTRSGVMAGTKENALLSFDQQLHHNMNGWIARHFEDSSDQKLVA